MTAVTCAALHPVRRASCTSKIFLSMYWTCFSFRCTQKIRKKTRPTAPRSSTIRVQVSGRFPCLDVFKVETGNLKSTIQQHLSIPCSKQHCTSQTPRSQHSDIVDFLPCLELRRWTAKARDARVEAFFVVLTSCRTPDGTRVTRPFVVWFPACVVQDRTLRKVVASVRSTDVSVTCAR